MWESLKGRPYNNSKYAYNPRLITLPKKEAIRHNIIKYYILFWNPVRIRNRLTPTVLRTKAARIIQATGE